MSDKKIPQDELLSFITEVMQREGVSFSGPSKRSYADRCWGLYKSLLMLAPALVVASGMPMSIYNVMSLRVAELQNGKRKYRVRFPLASKFLDHYLKRESYEKTFWRFFEDLTRSVARKDYTVMQASNKLSLGVEEHDEN